MPPTCTWAATAATFPRNVGELPDYYDHKRSRNRSYLFEGRTPLYPFGWGLSYTKFRFRQPRLDPPEIGAEGETTVSVDVTNTGSRAGDEVAHMYIHQRVASIARPVMETARLPAHHPATRRDKDGDL